MINDLGGKSAVWRALFAVRDRRFWVPFRLLVKEPPKMVLRRMLGPSLETGAVFDAALSGNYRAILIGCL
jgi:hypothetical protein